MCSLCILCSVQCATVHHVLLCSVQLCRKLVVQPKFNFVSWSLTIFVFFFFFLFNLLHFRIQWGIFNAFYWPIKVLNFFKIKKKKKSFIQVGTFFYLGALGDCIDCINCITYWVGAGSLTGLDQLDLLNNNLFSAIPKSLEALPYLKYLNLYFNKLSGEIPSSGVFINFTVESFLGNELLCGNSIFGVPPCTSQISSQQSRVKQILLRYIIPAIASIIIFIALVTMLRRHPKCKI